MCSYKVEAEAFAAKHLRQRSLSKPRRTDLERLHRVVQKRGQCERGEGRTYASCHFLAGLLRTVPEGSWIAWPLPRMDWLYHVMPMLQDVLTEHGIPWEDCRYGKIKALGKTVLFLTTDRIEHAMRGRSYYLVDTYGEVEESLYFSGR